MKQDLLQHLSSFGQQHLLDFWDDLNDQQRESLAAEIRAIDFPQLAGLFQHKDDEGQVRKLVAQAQQPPAFRLGAADARFTVEEARASGAQALRAGEVGFVLVAGGQGTRLGFDHPKGMFPIGPVSGKSLFAIHVEKIAAASRRWKAPLPLGLMTSPATNDATLAYFHDNRRFGLPEEDFDVFCQGTMPAVDATDGRVLLAEPHHVALSPDGHGGTLAALDRSGTLDKWRRRGIKSLFYFQVDNPLAPVGSPELVGYHRLAESELTSQVVHKQTPHDKVGNIVAVDGRLHVIEYSDLPEEAAERRRPDGSLEIWAGSIAVHVMEMDFLQRMAASADALPFHTARKKVSHLGPDGKPVVPRAPNAIKFERFIFDLLPQASKAIVVEVDRDEAFAPLKNGSGAEIDTPETVRSSLVSLHTEWLRAAGVEVADGVDVEISPRLALDAEELAGRIGRVGRVTEPTYFE